MWENVPLVYKGIFFFYCLFIRLVFPEGHNGVLLNCNEEVFMPQLRGFVTLI